ncbi:retrovirus-related pol polyprotein from transposon TNT 1-94 [Tanacetum coccineum]
MEAEVKQNVVDKKCAEIERKNILIKNENLIADCLSNELLYNVMNAVNTVSRFSEMHDAYTVEQARNVELEDEISKLKHKIQKDDHSEMIKHFSNLEYNTVSIDQNMRINQLNEYTPIDKKLATGIAIEVDTPVKCKPLYHAIDVELIPPQNRNNREAHLDYLKHLMESVETLHEIVEEARIEKPLDNALEYACFYTKQSQELLEYVIGTCSKEFSKRDKKVATTPLNRKKQVTFRETCGTSNNNTQTHVEQHKVQKTNVPVIPSTGQPEHISTSEIVITERFSNTTQKPLTRYKYRNKEDKTISTGIPTTAETQTIDAPIDLWNLDSDCSKHMTGSHFGTVRFGNEHFGAIIGYRDYVIDGVELLKGNRGSNLYTISVEDMTKSSPIYLLSKASKNKSWLWHRRLNHLNFGTINDLARKDLVRGLPWLKFEKDHLCSACQLGKSKKYTHKPKSKNTIIEVLHTLHIDLCGPMRVQSINGKRYILVIVDDYSRFTWVKFLSSKDETPDISHQKSVLRTPQQNGIVERWNHTLVEAAWTMLIFSKAPMFLWAEAVTTACYTQNRSLIHTRHNKTPYELMLLTEHMAPVHISSGLEPILMTPRQIRSRLVPNPVPVAPYVPLTNKDLEILLQPMFDEYFEPPSVERPIPHAPTVQVPVVSAGTPSSTTIDQDAPSTSHSPSSSKVQPPILHQGVVARPSFEDNPFAQADNDPFVNVFAPKPSFDESSSGDVYTAEPNQVIQPRDHLGKWTKDHLIDNVIGNLSRPVSTRKQLATNALWCFYHNVFSKVKPNNFKTAVTEPCWFDAMQVEIHKFD